MLSMLRKMAAALHRQRVRRITIRELMTLEDAALTDIGVERSQIRSFAEALVQGSDNQQARTESSVEVQATPATAHMPLAYDREDRVAA